MPLDNGDLKATPSKGVKTIVVTWLVGMVVVVVVGLRYIHINVQWLFLVHVKGGRWHIIPQLAVYTTYIPLIILAFWGAPYATTFYGNQKQPLICMYYYTAYDNSLLDSLPVLWQFFPSMMNQESPHWLKVPHAWPSNVVELQRRQRESSQGPWGTGPKVCLPDCPGAYRTSKIWQIVVILSYCLRSSSSILYLKTITGFLIDKSFAEFLARSWIFTDLDAKFVPMFG